jgi:putative phage-type endonuclease
MKFIYDDIKESIFNLMLEDIDINKVDLENTLISIYNLGESSVDLSKKYYLKNIIPQIMEICDKILSTASIVQDLMLLDLPAQRSKEWYEIRENILTASSLADALGKGHFKSRDEMLLSKMDIEQSKPNKYSLGIMEWGVKYEQIATIYYEYLTKTTIIEFGLIPHPQLKVFGASPDGICGPTSPTEYIGRMLEIKCPPKRAFTSEVPDHYWMQIQGQLETCDLPECDFFQVKLEEYSSLEEYNNDSNGNIGETSFGYPKGMILTFTKNEEKIYEYPKLFQTNEDNEIWKSNMIEKYSGYHLKVHWWKIIRYECTLVERNQVWWNSITPDIIEFWEEVEDYRENGHDELVKRIADKKSKRSKKFDNTITITDIQNMPCLLSDD